MLRLRRRDEGGGISGSRGWGRGFEWGGGDGAGDCGGSALGGGGVCGDAAGGWWCGEAASVGGAGRGWAVGVRCGEGDWSRARECCGVGERGGSGRVGELGSREICAG